MCSMTKRTNVFGYVNSSTTKTMTMTMNSTTVIWIAGDCMFSVNANESVKSCGVLNDIFARSSESFVDYANCSVHRFFDG